MLKKILGTAASRMIIAGISLFIALINARYLGPDGLGTIGLIVLGITIILLINNFIGGPTLVYLVPRENTAVLLLVSYGWSVIVIALFACILHFVKFVPAEFSNDVLLLSLMYSFFNIHLYFLLGSQRIREHNVITTLQQMIQLGGIILYFIILKKPSVTVFINILYLSYAFTLIASAYLVIRSVDVPVYKGVTDVFKRIIRLGFFVQIAYTIQMMNYRLSYYIIDFFVGRTGLGIYHFGNQLAEGTWVVGKSISIVQYSGISNTNDKEYAKRLTLSLMKFTFIASLLIIGILLLLPQSIFLFFGDSFSGTRVLIALLAVGIISNALSMMFSHYFAGLGKPHYNTIGSLVGFIFTVILGFWLIPAYGIPGAAITASFSYLSSLVYQIIIFTRMAHARPAEFLIKKADILNLRVEIQKLLKRSEQSGTGIEDNLPL
ncbi:MAG: polysaccharide biosynthesis C-terminal domain-containing protein [Bacteroidales bacterium]